MHCVYASAFCFQFLHENLQIGRTRNIEMVAPSQRRVESKPCIALDELTSNSTVNRLTGPMMPLSVWTLLITQLSTQPDGPSCSTDEQEDLVLAEPKPEVTVDANGIITTVTFRVNEDGKSVKVGLAQ